jgi:hypothetical protein
MSKPTETPTGTDLRRAALKDVESCVCKDRQNSYGDAEDNFRNIASIANVILAKRLSSPLDEIDVANLMIAVKLARAATTPSYRDNQIDIAGYAVCAVGILDRSAQSKSVV